MSVAGMEVTLSDEECAFLLRLTATRAAELDPAPVDRVELRKKLKALQCDAFVTEVC